MASTMDKVVERIVRYLKETGNYVLPYRYHTSEDGTVLPVKVIMWKDNVPCCEHEMFGITVTTRGYLEHTLFTIQKKHVVVDNEFIGQQLERVKRIMTRPLRALCGTLGPNKTDMMDALGMDSKALGIDACCICAKQTTIKTHPCAHPVCIACFVHIEKCPLCRNEDITCDCESDEEEVESDDEFDAV